MVNGSTWRDAMISAAHNIGLHKQQVNELNVFPVPDGDTGTNMSLTIGAAQKEIQHLPDSVGIGQVASAVAAALLRGARGNSGVILSLLFRGFSKALKDKTEASTQDLWDALKIGVDSAYKAVMKPTEGTMLTVARVACEKTQELTNLEPAVFWEKVCDEADAILLDTPDMLPVLKKAGVVDSGGQGLCHIYRGMLSVLKDGVIIESNEEDEKPAANTFVGSGSVFVDDHEDINFTYCTEFIINRENDNDPLKLRAYLDSIGDCVVVVDDDDIIKVHVHTDHPGQAIEEALTYGPLTKIKIDNIREQHAQKQSEGRAAMAAQAAAAAADPEDEFPYRPVDKGMPYGFLAIASGDGVKQLFLDLGANAVLSGGQTMNPSTEDILRAVQSIPAKTVFVLPNNKNIILAAEQAIRLADRNVVVLQTVTIPQGLSAMLAYDPDGELKANQIAMRDAFEKVETGLVTYAARDSAFDDKSIQKNEIIAMHDGKIDFTEKDIIKAAVRLTRHIAKKTSQYVTVLYGQDVSAEQAAKVETALRDKLPDETDLVVASGGQPVYYFIIGVE